MIALFRYKITSVFFIHSTAYYITATGTNYSTYYSAKHPVLFMDGRSAGCTCNATNYGTFRCLAPAFLFSCLGFFS